VVCEGPTKGWKPNTTRDYRVEIEPIKRYIGDGLLQSLSRDQIQLLQRMAQSPIILRSDYRFWHVDPAQWLATCAVERRSFGLPYVRNCPPEEKGAIGDGTQRFVQVG
jgi:hypothetical protein